MCASHGAPAAAAELLLLPRFETPQGLTVAVRTALFASSKGDDDQGGDGDDGDDSDEHADDCSRRQAISGPAIGGPAIGRGCPPSSAGR